VQFLASIQLKRLFTSGKVRLAKWFVTMPPKQKAKIVKDVTQLVLARRTRMCNFLEYKGPVMFPFVMNPLMEVGLGRLEGRISAICVSVLCDGHWPVRQ
jgi:hypothetical protein